MNLLKRTNKHLKKIFVAASALAIVGVVVATTLQQRTTAAPGPIAGSVFNDVNANGAKDAGEGAFSNLAIINLYNSSGTYVKSRTSDANGNFTLSGLAAGTYYVSVYNTGRTAAVTTTPALINEAGVHVEPTYAGVGTGAGAGSGPICVGASPTYTQRSNYSSSPSEWIVGAPNGTAAGPCFGGRSATLTNPSPATVLPVTYAANTDYTTLNSNLNSALNTQKMVSKVVLTNDSGVNNVDFGLSAHAVTNTANSGQGSLAQFIANANLVAGSHPMRFAPAVPTNQASGGGSWWRISPTAALETISGVNTTIDGRAYSNINGTTQLDANPGVLTGPSVGTENYKIADFQKPELELYGDPRADDTTALLRITGSDTTIQNLAMNSSANYTTLDSKFVQQSGGTNMIVQDNLMGVHPVTGASSANRPLFSIQTAYLVSLNATGTYRHNFLSSNDQRGMLLAGGLLGSGNVVAVLLGDWIIEQNDGPSAGIAFGAGTTRIQVRHNNMPTAALDAGPLNSSLGLHVLTENTISGGAGVQLQAGLQNTITKNVITNATGSNPGILIENLSTGNFISQNRFGGNGGNAIDLNGDGVSENELLGCVTLSSELIGLANLGIARPNLQNVRLSGSQLTVNINYCGVGIYDMELYKTTSGSGDSSAGEGTTYLGRFADLALINGTVTDQTMTVSGLNPGDSISAILINPITGDTSEFGPNTTVLSPPQAPTTAPDMTPATDTGASNSDNLTYDNTPTFTGSCTNGQEVTLYIDNVALVPTQVCAGGNYSITPSTPIADGAYLMWSTFKNGFGESTASPVLAITIDTTVPATPAAPDMTPGTDTGVSNSDNITNNPQPAFTGSCTITESTKLYIDGNLVATALCVDGTYTITVPTALASGAHTATIVAEDHAGNSSTTSAGLSFSVDTAAPSAPAITDPADNSATNDTTPTISGSGENGAAITVRDQNGATICTAAVASGSWSCTPSSALAEGLYQLRATQTDAAGNTSGISTIVSLTVDTTAPAAPVITAPANGAVTNDNTPTISGTATANSTVLLQIDGQAPVTVQADASGDWSYTSPSALSQGSHAFIAIERDAAGNESAPSATVNLTIDTTRPSVTVNKKAGQADPTIDALLRYTIVFSEAIDATTFAPSDFTLISDPASPATYVSELSQINETTWEAVVTGMPNNTTVSLSLDANKLQDAAGNDNQASTSTDNSVRYEVGSPSVLPLLTNDDTPVVTGACIAAHNLQVELQGPSPHTYHLACNNGQWSLQVPDQLSEGTYDVIVTDTTVGSLTNDPANQNDALRIDTTRPSVTVNKKAGQADPTATNEAFFTLIFSEAMDAGSLVVGDLDVGGTSGTTQLTQINETTWEARVSNLTSGDTVTLSLPANRAQDLAGNNNLAGTSTDNSVRYDGTAPAKPVLTAPANNSVTNNATVTVSGTGENGTTVTVLIDGASAACVNQPIVVSGGTWSCVLAAPLADGAHTVSARLTDEAGNVSDNADSRTVTVDTTAPVAPQAPTLVSSSDSGESNSDGRTSDSTPTFTGSCTTGDVVRLFAGATQIGQATCVNGSYEITADPALTNGPHDITITVTDPAGNVSPASPVTSIVIDTAAPGAPAITAPANNSTTSNTAPVISGTGETGTLVALTINGNPLTCSEGVIRVVNGTWSCTPAAPLADNTYSLVARQTDVAGNQSAPSSTISVTIDTSAPATLGQPDLVSSSDTGASNTDNETSDNTPTFSGACQTGDTVQLFAGSTQLGSTTCAGNSYQITTDPALADGAQTIHVVAIDSAGNSAAPSPTLVVLIDTAPPAPLAAPDMIPGSDSGSSNTDNTTSDNTPTFTGSCTNQDSIQLYISGALVGQTTCASNQYAITPASSISDGAHDVVVRATDLAGNQSGPSPTTTITVDTAEPAQPTVISPVPGEVVDATPTITGQGEPNTTVNVDTNGDSHACSEGHAVNTNGTWSCSPNQPLDEGPHALEVTVTDPAGNTSDAHDTTTFNVDTTAPAVPAAPDMTSASDTGSSNTDNLTTNRTPTFTGSCTTGDTVKLYADGAPAGEALCAGSSYSIPSTIQLTEGVHAITVTATDPVGNASNASPALSVTIDLTAAAPTSAPDLETASDNGASNTDNITSNTTPTFTGSCTTGDTVLVYAGATQIAQVPCTGGSFTATTSPALGDGNHQISFRITDPAGNTSGSGPALTITIDTTAPVAPVITTPPNNSATNNPHPTIAGTGINGHQIQVRDGGTSITCAEGTVTVTNDTWSCTPLVALSTGSHSFTATQTDLAGNTSVNSTAVTLLIDNTPPARPGRPDLIASSDSGSSNTDNITNVTSPVIAGTCVTGDTVILRLAGSNVAQQVCAGNAYQLTVPGPLTPGSKAFTVTATDPAGNTSSPSLTLTVVIDTVAEKPATPDLEIDSDSGVSNTDNITNVSFPTITGTCQAGETVRVFFDNTLHKTTPCFPPFLAQPLDTLTQGNHDVTIEVIDIAGNVSTRSDILVITIDNLAPTIPTVLTPQEGTTPTVNSSSYTTSGTTEANALVTVWKGSTQVCSAVSAGNGSWSCQVTGLANGSHTFNYMSTDRAGNPSPDTVKRTINVSL